MHSGRGSGSRCAEAAPDSPAIASAAASPVILLRLSFLGILILPRFCRTSARLARNGRPGNLMLPPIPGSNDRHWVRSSSQFSRLIAAEQSGLWEGPGAGPSPGSPGLGAADRRRDEIVRIVRVTLAHRLLVMLDALRRGREAKGLPIRGAIIGEILDAGGAVPHLRIGRSGQQAHGRERRRSQQPPAYPLEFLQHHQSPTVAETPARLARTTGPATE